MLFKHSFLFFILIGFNANAQLLKQRFLPVSKPWYIASNDSSMLGFSGGFHAPNFFSLDLDNDGIDELVAKDAFSDKEWVFKKSELNIKKQWVVATYLEEVLPPLQTFTSALDLNNDGLVDIVTGENKLEIFINETTDSVRFSKKPRALKFKLEATFFPIEFQVGETPCLADIDGDGLIDVLVFDANGERVVWYKNISSDPNDLKFEIATEKWGFFKEEGLNFEIRLGAAKKAHPGSRLLAFDHDGDGDMDLLLSDITSPISYFLENGKSDFNLPYDSMISVSERYPLEGQKIDIPYFPSFSLVDVDFDNDLDLICANSSRSPVENGQVWLYENGSGKGFDLSLKTKSFLQEKSIDLGILAAPTTFDADGDGDLDLLVAAINHSNGNIFEEQFAFLAFFENIGSSTNPLYELNDKDYLGYHKKNIRFLSPTIGDIDNDGIDDLVIGTARGEIIVRLNTGEKNKAFLFSKVDLLIEGIDVGTEAAPIIYDVNGDDINDLIVGELAGNLNYFKGLGNMKFELVTEKWGQVRTNTFYWQPIRDSDGNVVDSSKQFLSVGGSHPAIMDIDNNGKPELIVGSTWGKMYYYPDIEFEEYYFKKSSVWYHNPYLGNNYDKDMGSNTRPHLTDLNNDGFVELLIGVFNGGIELFSADSVVVSKPEPVLYDKKISIYPNPSNGNISIQNHSTNEIAYRVFNIQGREIKLDKISALETKGINLPKGIYFIESADKQHIEVKRLIVY